MKTVDREKLWEEYQKKKTPELREKLIIEYSPLVKLVAGRLSMYLGYNVEYDDLVSYGIFGLIDAIDKFDLGKEVKFETYASLRIRGTILDQIRKMDWIPRTVRQKQKKIDEAIKQVEMRTGKNASDEEIAQELGLSEDELTTWQSQLKVTNIVSLNEYLEQGAEPVMDARRNSHFIQPEDKVEEEELKQKLEESLEVLTEKERKVILLYYYEDLTLKEISNVLEVSESTLYPVLRRLQKDECLEAYNMEYAGRNRKYYKLTDKGAAQLNLYRSEWEIYSSKITRMFEEGV